MRLTVVHPASLWCSWGMSYGLTDCLQRMGHEVTAVPVDPQKPHALLKRPKLGECDAVILSGPEHLMPLLVEWPHRIGDAPVVGWLHESVERPDYKLNVEAIKKVTDICFCPAAQDHRHGFRHLPLGVDTAIFKPGEAKKDVDAGFIGLLYAKRVEFLKGLAPHLNGTRLVCGNVQVLELDGLNPRKTAELYAENIRRIKVFVNLPSLSVMAVSKIYEVLACGTPVLTPEISEMENLKSLPVSVYRGPNDLSKRLHSMLKENPSTESLAKIMHGEHRLELRCDALVKAVEELN